MRGNIYTSRARHAAAALPIVLTGMLAGAQVASAQSAENWSLPEPTSSPSTPTVQGPIDGENPVVRPRSVPSAVPTPTLNVPPPAPTTPLPRPSPTARDAPAPQPAPPTSPATQPSSTQTAAQPEPVTTTAPSAVPAPEPIAAEPTGSPTFAGTPAVPSEAASPAVSSPIPAWWWAVPLMLLIGLSVFLTLRRRKSEAVAPRSSSTDDGPERTAEDVQNTRVLSKAPQPSPAAPLPFAADRRPPSRVEPRANIPVAQEPGGLAALTLEPAWLRLSLVYATLQFRISIAPEHDFAGGRLLGDMIGAHASISPDQQLAPAIEALALLKTVPAAPAGETVELTGQIQLPLNAIPPLQQANATFFVPLVRIAIVDASGAPLLRRVFTVGQDSGAAALAPIRTDLGPREMRELAAREVEAARSYPLLATDLQRAAG